MFYCVPIGQSAKKVFYDKLKLVDYHEALMVLPNRHAVNVAQNEGKVNAGVWDILLNKILELDTATPIAKVRSDVVKLIFKEILKDEQEFPYFAQLKNTADDVLADKAGLVDSIYSLYNEAKRNNVNLAELTNFDRENYNNDLRGQRGEEICKLVQRYGAFCKQSEPVIVDLEERYHRAVAILKTDLAEQFPYKIVAFCDGYEYSALQLELIKALQCAGVKVYASLCYEPEERKELYSLSKDNYVALKEILGEAEIVPHENQLSVLDKLRNNYNAVFCDTKFNEADADKVVSVMSFINREEEMRWVLANVKNKIYAGVAAKDIVVAVRNLQQYPGFFEIAKEYGIPVNKAVTTSLKGQPLAEFVSNFIGSLKRTPEGVLAYFRLLNSSIVNFDKEELPKEIAVMPTQKYFTSRQQAQKAIQYYYESNTQLSKDKVLTALDEHLSEMEDQGKKELKDYLCVLDKALNLVANRYRLANKFKAGKISLKTLKLATLAKDTIKSALDAKIYAYSLLGENKLFSLEEFSGLVDEVINSESIVLAGSKPDGVRFVSVAELAGERVPYVYLMGNREDEFPAPLKRRWLYTEQEREALNQLGVNLVTKKNDYDHDVIFFGQTIASAEKQLCLTWFRDAGVAAADAGCSVFVDYVKQYFPNVPFTAVRYNDIASAREAAISQKEAYASQEEYNFNGTALEAEIAQKVWQKLIQRKFSASSLEEYRKCPLRFLASRVWRTENRSILDDPPDVKHVGTFVHDVLETFIRDYILPENKAIAADEQELLLEQLTSVFNSKAEEYEEKGFFGGPVWAIYRNELFKKVKLWLDYEIQHNNNFKPCGLEWEFGYGDDAGLVVETPALYENELPEECKAAFCGKIDRFDTDGKKVHITDYKTGSAPDSKDVQIPLYILAVQELYKNNDGEPVEVCGGSYLELKKEPAAKGEIKMPFGLTKTGNIGKTNVMSVDDSLAHLRNVVIGDKLKGIHKGDFVIADKPKCRYCVLEPYCDYKKEEEENE